MLILIQVAGCSPTRPATYGQNGITTNASDPVWTQQLPPLPEDKAIAAAFPFELLGSDYSGCSPNAVPEGDYLRLNSPLNGIAWGIWHFGPGPQTMNTIEATLSLDVGDVYYALPDYVQHCWKFVGPESGGEILELNNLRNKSPAGNFYIAVITTGGSSAVVHKLILTTEFPWSVSTIDSDGVVGKYTSLAVTDGVPGISYCRYDSGDLVPALMYIHSLDPTGNEWDAPRVLASGADEYDYTSLEIVDGNPAISYYSLIYSGTLHGGSLEYVRANDSAGSAWGPVKTVDSDMLSPDYRGQYSSLAIVDGVPAISYYGAMHHGLRYIEAADVDGNSWQSPQLLDNSADVGQFTTLVQPLDSQPIIAYYDMTNGNLRGIGKNFDGSAWNPYFYIDGNADDVGKWASGTLVGNELVVCYSNVTGNQLLYARYNMIAGEWVSTPVLTEDIGIDASLAVINDRPAISYFDGAQGDLKYVRALDADGQDWGDPETVDTIGEVGRFTSLAEVDGMAAISYYDATNATLKYAIRLGP